MKSRWIATVVCLLYVSVSTGFAAIHHHDTNGADSGQCAACAWHHEGGRADLPAIAIAVERPLTIAWAEEPAHTFFRELSLRIHPSRGPPILPL